jgi:hypothetical protein
MLSRCTLLLPLVLAAIGCGGADSRVKACEAKRLTIDTGFAGCITSADDVGDPPPPPSATPNFGVAIFDSKPSTQPDSAPPPAFMTQSDADGYYEVAVPPGHYWVCTTFRRCIEEDLGEKKVMLLDYEFSNSMGWGERPPSL